MTLDTAIIEKAQSWAQNPYFDAEFKAEIQELLDSSQEQDQKELVDRFYKEMEFGTGGLRGIIGAGSNRINRYTIQKATQGLANYIKKSNAPHPSVAIAYDCRNFSLEFTEEAAAVLAANNIKVYLFDSLKPTPMLSYAVRKIGCTAGIVVTASHNPKNYNGYKVYWSDGCQVTPPHDQSIIDEVNNITDFSTIQSISYQDGIKKGLIEIIPKDLEEAYYQKVASLSQTHGDANHDFGVIYTPLHGTGLVPVEKVFALRGFNKLRTEPAQSIPDGNFPTLLSPNPEESSSMQMAKEMATEEDHLILATDPDADRIGAMTRHKGEWITLNGNQIGQCLLFYYLSKLKENQRLMNHGVYITTIVTSTLGSKIAAGFGLEVVECLTGFKWIGEIIEGLEKKQKHFVFGTEESHGYLFSDFVRDKDGIMAAMFLAELAADLKQFNLSLVDLLNQIYNIYDCHQDHLENKVIPGKEGAEKIRNIMTGLRENPPAMIGGVKVTEVRDYQTSEITSFPSGKKQGEITLPKSNVIAFYLADKSRITARPSGTEPKIKFYFNLCGDNQSSLSKQKATYIADFNKIIDQY